MQTLYQRHLAVLAGHPIGSDAAAVTDHQRSEAEAINFGQFAAQTHARQSPELVWPPRRGSNLFTVVNFYDDRPQTYSAEFCRKFLAWSSGANNRSFTTFICRRKRGGDGEGWRARRTLGFAFPGLARST